MPFIQIYTIVDPIIRHTNCTFTKINYSINDYSHHSRCSNETLLIIYTTVAGHKQHLPSPKLQQISNKISIVSSYAQFPTGKVLFAKGYDEK